MLGTSLVVGWFIAMRLAKQDGIDQQEAGTIYMWTAVWSIIGSRLLWSSPLPSRQRQGGRDGEQGGLVAYGGMIGGFLASWYCCRKRGIPLLQWADVAAPSVVLGTAITRIGCLLFGCDYGARTTCPGRSGFPGQPLSPTEPGLAAPRRALRPPARGAGRSRSTRRRFTRSLVGLSLFGAADADPQVPQVLGSGLPGLGARLRHPAARSSRRPRRRPARRTSARSRPRRSSASCRCCWGSACWSPAAEYRRDPEACGLAAAQRPTTAPRRPRAQPRRRQATQAALMRDAAPGCRCARRCPRRRPRARKRRGARGPRRRRAVAGFAAPRRPRATGPEGRGRPAAPQGGAGPGGAGDRAAADHRGDRAPARLVDDIRRRLDELEAARRERAARRRSSGEGRDASAVQVPRRGVRHPLPRRSLPASSPPAPAGPLPGELAAQGPARPPRSSGFSLLPRRGHSGRARRQPGSSTGCSSTPPSRRRSRTPSCSGGLRSLASARGSSRFRSGSSAGPGRRAGVHHLSSPMQAFSLDATSA